MRCEEEVNSAIRRYADTVYRVCLLHLKNPSDTEDIFQEVFLKYALSSVRFSSPEHEKAWLLRVTVNACKDLLKSFFHTKTVPIDEAAPLPQTDSHSSRLWEAVLSLPVRYRDVLYLHYYEGYSAPEIGDILHRSTNTVYTQLARGRTQLQELLGGDE